MNSYEKELETCNYSLVLYNQANSDLGLQKSPLAANGKDTQLRPNSIRKGTVKTIIVAKKAAIILPK